MATTDNFIQAFIDLVYNDITSLYNEIDILPGEAVNKYFYDTDDTDIMTFYKYPIKKTIINKETIYLYLYGDIPFLSITYDKDFTFYLEETEGYLKVLFYYTLNNTPKYLIIKLANTFSETSATQIIKDSNNDIINIINSSTDSTTDSTTTDKPYYIQYDYTGKEPYQIKNFFESLRYGDDLSFDIEVKILRDLEYEIRYVGKSIVEIADWISSMSAIGATLDITSDTSRANYQIEIKPDDHMKVTGLKTKLEELPLFTGKIDVQYPDPFIRTNSDYDDGLFKLKTYIKKKYELYGNNSDSLTINLSNSSFTLMELILHSVHRTPIQLQIGSDDSAVKLIELRSLEDISVAVNKDQLELSRTLIPNAEKNENNVTEITDISSITYTNDFNYFIERVSTHSKFYKEINRVQTSTHLLTLKVLAELTTHISYDNKTLAEIGAEITDNALALSTLSIAKDNYVFENIYNPPPQDFNIDNPQHTYSSFLKALNAQLTKGTHFCDNQFEIFTEYSQPFTSLPFLNWTGGDHLSAYLDQKLNLIWLENGTESPYKITNNDPSKTLKTLTAEIQDDKKVIANIAADCVTESNPKNFVLKRSLISKVRSGSVYQITTNLITKLEALYVYPYLVKILNQESSFPKDEEFKSFETFKNTAITIINKNKPQNVDLYYEQTYTPQTELYRIFNYQMNEYMVNNNYQLTSDLFYNMNQAGIPLPILQTMFHYFTGFTFNSKEQIIKEIQSIFGTWQIEDFIMNTLYNAKIEEITVPIFFCYAIETIIKSQIYYEFKKNETDTTWVASSYNQWKVLQEYPDNNLIVNFDSINTEITNNTELTDVQKNKLKTIVNNAKIIALYSYADYQFYETLRKEGKYIDPRIDVQNQYQFNLSEYTDIDNLIADINAIQVPGSDQQHLKASGESSLYVRGEDLFSINEAVKYNNDEEEWTILKGRYSSSDVAFTIKVTPISNERTEEWTLSINNQEGYLHIVRFIEGYEYHKLTNQSINYILAEGFDVKLAEQLKEIKNQIYASQEEFYADLILTIGEPKAKQYQGFISEYLVTTGDEKYYYFSHYDTLQNLLDDLENLAFDENQKQLTIKAEKTFNTTFSPLNLLEDIVDNNLIMNEPCNVYALCSPHNISFSMELGSTYQMFQKPYYAQVNIPDVQLELEFPKEGTKADIEDWQIAFDKLADHNIDTIVGITHIARNYENYSEDDNYAIHNLGKNHIIKMSTNKQGKRRRYIASAMNFTLPDKLVTLSKQFNCNRLLFVGYGQFDYDLNYVEQLFHPCYTAAKMGSMICGSPPWLSLTNRKIKGIAPEGIVPGIKSGGKIFPGRALTKAERQTLIQAGVITPITNGNYNVILRYLSTWQVDNNYYDIFPSVLRCADFCRNDIEKKLNEIRIQWAIDGYNPVAVDIVIEVNKLLAKYEKEGWITSTSNGNAYSNVNASIIDDVFLWDMTLRLPIPTEFIFGTFYTLLEDEFLT